MTVVHWPFLALLKPSVRFKRACWTVKRHHHPTWLLARNPSHGNGHSQTLQQRTTGLQLSTQKKKSVKSCCLTFLLQSLLCARLSATPRDVSPLSLTTGLFVPVRSRCKHVGYQATRCTSYSDRGLNNPDVKPDNVAQGLWRSCSQNLQVCIQKPAATTWGWLRNGSILIRAHVKKPSCTAEINMFTAWCKKKKKIGVSTANFPAHDMCGRWIFAM